jgi:hypothetical protein
VGSTLPVFIDLEAPTGTMNGVNTIFTLSAAPSPASSLHLYRNGLLQRAGTDYNLTGSTVTFVTAATPQTGDLLLASFRTDPI